MITERGRVELIDNDRAWVVCARQAGCARCAAGQGCGGGLLGRLLGDRLHRVEATTAGLALDPGDQVELGLEESALMRGALLVYGLPLLGLLVLPMCLHVLFEVRGDGPLLLAGAAGFIAGMLLARRRSRHMLAGPGWQPVITRKLEPGCEVGDRHPGA